MDEKIRAKQTLDEIVIEVLNDLYGATDMGRYPQFLQWAIRGYKHLRLFDLNNVDTARIEMRNGGIVELPEDFVSFVAIGIPFKGKFWTFTRNDLIVAPLEKGFCEKEIIPLGEKCGVHIDHGGTPVGYGVSGGLNQYYFEVEEEHDRILVNGFPRTTCLLKYVGTGINVGKDTYVPGVAVEAVIAFIHKQRAKFDPNMTRGEKLDFKQDFVEAEEALRFVTGPSLDELMDAFYSSITQTLKR